MISFLGSLLAVLHFACAIATVCAACLVVDTVLNMKYYQWEKAKRLEQENELEDTTKADLEDVAQYDAAFFDDGK